MASSGGHWVKLNNQAGTTDKLVFVPQGKTIEEVLTGQPAEGGGFPSSVDGLTKVKSLGGSTGAMLVKDENGNLYVMKKGASEGHLLEEANADAAYKALGVDVPESRIYQTPTGAVKLAKFVDGKPLSDTDNPTQVVESLKKGFAADALLGNWDVIGLAKDNVMLGNNGKTYRIDNGGSLRYRAMGALKSNWGQYPHEVFTLRSGKNAQTASVFGKMTLKDVAAQVSGLTSRSSGLLATFPAGLRPLMSARLGRMGQFRDIVNTLGKAGHSDSVITGYITKLWNGLGSGSIKFDPKTASEILNSFGQIGG